MNVHLVRFLATPQVPKLNSNPEVNTSPLGRETLWAYISSQSIYFNVTNYHFVSFPRLTEEGQPKQPPNHPCTQLIQRIPPIIKEYTYHAHHPPRQGKLYAQRLSHLKVWTFVGVPLRRLHPVGMSGVECQTLPQCRVGIGACEGYPLKVLGVVLWHVSISRTEISEMHTKVKWNWGIHMALTMSLEGLPIFSTYLMGWCRQEVCMTALVVFVTLIP